MKIRMRTTMAGPKISAQAGSVIDVSDSEAKVLCEGGFAELAEAAAPRAATEKAENASTGPMETAAVAPQDNGKLQLDQPGADDAAGAQGKTSKKK